MTKVRDMIWSPEYNSLKRIEEFMTYGICYEYMEISVMTPCSHNYCSLCIRKYLHYESQCPVCFYVFFEKDLYVNRAMDGIIEYYLQIREKLINIIENQNMYNIVIQQNKEIISSIQLPNNNQLSKYTNFPEMIQYESKSHIINSLSDNKFKYNTPSIDINTSSKFMQRYTMNCGSAKKNKILLHSIVNKNIVFCPVCSAELSENLINVHLDACLKREDNEEIIKKKESISKRLPMPKLVLRVMKHAELRKKMKKFGLSTQGDRKILENKFTRYSIIYNAELDKLAPRPIADLIKQCELEEKQERKMDRFLTSTSSSNVLFFL